MVIILNGGSSWNTEDTWSGALAVGRSGPHCTDSWVPHSWKNNLYSSVVKQQETLAFKGHTGLVTIASCSPDGKRIVSGGVGGSVKVWDISSLATSR